MFTVQCIQLAARGAYFQELSIQRDRKHCINFADNKNYLVGTVSYLQTLLEGDNELLKVNFQNRNNN